MLDKIYLNQMAFYGYHGVYPEENKLGQRFLVDIILECDLQEVGLTDRLDLTVNYGEVYEVTRQIVEGKPFKLVESVAETLATALLSKFPIVVRLTIKVTKPDPPIRGHYDSVAIGITRGRQND
jgi:7,8-dihydroneopterin aldolase/epimerase/oxygenase